MKKFCITTGLVILFAVGLSWAYEKGRQACLIAEFKVYQSNLTMIGAEQHTDELREFLKGRYYYLANRIPSDWLPINRADFGAPQDEFLGTLSLGKEAMSPQTEYKQFLVRVE